MSRCSSGPTDRETHPEERSAKLPRIRLRARPPAQHPWIYRKRVEFPRHPPPPGSLVEVVDREGAFVGRGFLHTGSQIALRLLTRQADEAVDRAFFRQRLQEALELRRPLMENAADCDSWRLVHGEADGLSGLIIDRFAGTLVIEPYSAGWRGAILSLVIEVLQELLPDCRPVYRPSPRTAEKESCDFSADAARYPAEGSLEIREHGLHFHLDLGTGQKTGFFLDQRDNRRRVRAMAAGRLVWDLCCYTGGFALQAAAGGAARVTGVDTDPDAIELARRNARRNRLKPEFLHQNAFDFLRARGEAGEHCDLLILDPAKLAGSRDDLPRARRTYADLNRLGCSAVRPGGWLVTCSCSGLISEAEFLEILQHSAHQAGRLLQVTAIHGAAADHPFRSDFPEARYLKCVFARVL